MHSIRLGSRPKRRLVVALVEEVHQPRPHGPHSVVPSDPYLSSLGPKLGFVSVWSHACMCAIKKFSLALFVRLMKDGNIYMLESIPTNGLWPIQVSFPLGFLFLNL
jgi:hypothetical protein